MQVCSHPPHLERQEALRALERLLGESVRVENAHEHFAALLDCLQRRRGRGIQVILDGLDLAEDLGGDTADLSG